MVKKIIFWGSGLVIILEILLPNVEFINYKTFFAHIIVGLILFITALGYLLKPSLYTKSSLDFPLVFYFAWLLVSFLFSPFKSASGYSFLNSAVLITFYFLLVNSLTQKEQIDYLLHLCIFSALLLCFYTFLFQEEFVGSFGNPNLFASFLVSVLPLALIKIYQTEEKFFYFASFLIFLLSLFLTQSRAGIGGGIFSLILFFSLGFYKEIIGDKKKLKSLYQILSIAIILGLIFHKKLFSSFVLSLKDRIFIWKGAMRLIKERFLFGWGVGNFPIYFPRYSPPQLRQIYPDQFVNNAHNEFLTLTAELGVVGLILFLWILGKVFLIVKKNLNSKDSFVSLVSLGTFCSLVGVLLINFFDVSLRFLFTAIFFWLMLGVLGGLDTINKENFLRKNPLLKRIAIYFVCIVLSIFLLKQAIYGLKMSKRYAKEVGKLRINLSELERIKKETEEKICQDKGDAQIYFKLGTIYAKMMDWQKAKEYLEKAINSDVNMIFAYTNLGNVYAELNDFDRAIDYYQQAIEISPDYLNAHYNLGFIYFKKGEIEKAVKEFDFILSKNKEDFYAWQMRQIIFE